MKSVVGYWELMLEARGARKRSFRSWLAGGGEETASLF